MATRVKRIYQEFYGTGAPSATFTLSENPSTTGDITTRVLIDSIWWVGGGVYDGSTGSSWLYINLAGKVVARCNQSYPGAGNYFSNVLITGGDSVVIQNASVGSQSNLVGTAQIIVPGGYFASWHFPTQFYSSVGDSVTFEQSSPNTTGLILRVSLICIGEY
jgi:hypothetical protein